MITFVLMAAVLFGGEVAAWLVCDLTRTPLPAGAGWALCATVALLLGAVATLMLDWLVLTPLRSAGVDARSEAAAMKAELTTQQERRRRLRHDLRGALSPALLTADRLLTNADPAVQRAGQMMVRTVERASMLLSEGEEDG